MKTKTLCLASAILLAGLGATIAQSKYSGIYSGKVGGRTKFMAAVTAGGRVVAADASVENFRGITDPAKSTVSALGKLKAVTPNGDSINASINSSYGLSGTVKMHDNGQTVRFSGARIYK
jgi:hypothetical protein